MHFEQILTKIRRNSKSVWYQEQLKITEGNNKNYQMIKEQWKIK